MTKSTHPNPPRVLRPGATLLPASKGYAAQAVYFLANDRPLYRGTSRPSGFVGTARLVPRGPPRPINRDTPGLPAQRAGRRCASGRGWLGGCRVVRCMGPVCALSWRGALGHVEGIMLVGVLGGCRVHSWAAVGAERAETLGSGLGSLTPVVHRSEERREVGGLTIRCCFPGIGGDLTAHSWAESRRHWGSTSSWFRLQPPSTDGQGAHRHVRALV